MDIYSTLDIIDLFEERVGHKIAVQRACDFMVSYLSSISNDLPKLATESIEVAVKFRNGLISESEVILQKNTVQDHLKTKSGLIGDLTAEIGYLKCTFAILSFYSNPFWGGGASEIVSNFFDITERIKSSPERINALVHEYFT